MLCACSQQYPACSQSRRRYAQQSTTELGALVKLKDWQQAAEAVILAVNEHGENLKTALEVQTSSCSCKG